MTLSKMMLKTRYYSISRIVVYSTNPQNYKDTTLCLISLSLAYKESPLGYGHFHKSYFNTLSNSLHLKSLKKVNFKSKREM